MTLGEKPTTAWRSPSWPQLSPAFGRARRVYLYELGHNQNQIRVLTDWTIDLFGRPDTSKLYEDRDRASLWLAQETLSEAGCILATALSAAQSAFANLRSAPESRGLLRSQEG